MLPEMTQEKLREVLEQHVLYTNRPGYDLYRVNLQGVDLQEVNLQGVNLRGVNLQGSDLQGSDLSGVNLYRADLRGVNLRRADLRGADLREVNLDRAELGKADLRGADLPAFQLCGEGVLTGFKKASGKVVELSIPAETPRTSSLVGRKCRCAGAKVVAIWNTDRTSSGITEVTGDHDLTTVYKVGKTVKPDKYNDDIRVECTNGIHFFITFDEAAKY